MVSEPGLAGGLGLSQLFAIYSLFVDLKVWRILLGLFDSPRVGMRATREGGC